MSIFSQQVVSLARQGLSSEWQQSANQAKAQAIAEAVEKDALIKQEAADDAKRKTDAVKAVADAAKQLATTAQSDIHHLQRTTAEQQRTTAEHLSTLSSQLNQLGGTNLLFDSDYKRPLVWSQNTALHFAKVGERRLIRVNVKTSGQGQIGVVQHPDNAKTTIIQGQRYTLSFNV